MSETLKEMPKYNKFLKDIISNKWKWVDYETTKLMESVTLSYKKKLPQKLINSRSFTIHCTIGNSFFDWVLFDHGTSINLIHFSIFKKLRLVEVKPTTVHPQLADKLITYPRDIIKDVLIKVDSARYGGGWGDPFKLRYTLSCHGNNPNRHATRKTHCKSGR